MPALHTAAAGAAAPGVVLPPVDVVVVGAGAAGLYTALVAADAGARVRVVSSSPLSESASYHAQGGLAAALAPDDSPELHLRDTLAAGREAARESAARTLCEEAPDRVRELERRGVEFDSGEDGELLLGLEGGHSRRRIVHAGGSSTGRQIAGVLSAAALGHSRVDVHERRSARGLWVEEGRCVGAVTDVKAMPAKATVLATGGAAALWLRTTNPRGALGSGLVLARRAGAALADLELLQFHPTALVSDGPRDGFLITEAVRGEGALLLNERGERFVDELAPRDEVAGAVQAELERSGKPAVMLDMRAVAPEGFPNVMAALAEAGLDPRRELVPVAPAAHYAVGGVVTDREGRSSLPGLYAVGECACTGIHGANRLASNSLSECFVLGRRAAIAAVTEPAVATRGPAPAPALPTAPSEATRAALWAHAGIVRSRDGLVRLLDEPHPLARLIGRSAIAREESRGCHLRSDFPDRDPALDGGHLVIEPDTEIPAIRHWT